MLAGPGTASVPDDPQLRVIDLRREFHSGGGLRRAPKHTVHAVDGISFDLAAGEALAVVGESGSGKTTLARVVAGLTPPSGGELEFEGRPLRWDGRNRRDLRSKIQMIFQDPLGSLDPRWRVRDLIREPLDNFGHKSRQAREHTVDEILEAVGLDPAQGTKRASELSGGQRQRIGIARAVVLRPKLVVCDEPVSALDISIRGQILELLAGFRREYGLTYIYISHDLSTVRKLCDRILTMYLGQAVELSPVAAFFAQPLHPYAQALLSAVPVADPEIEERRARVVLQGEVADATRVPTGCRFHPRCPLAQEICRKQEPELREVLPGRWARCHFAPEARVAELSSFGERTETPTISTGR
jgi:oligopeptide/dipeptide ABC transporter ATP-binding protein